MSDSSQAVHPSQDQDDSGVLSVSTTIPVPEPADVSSEPPTSSAQEVIYEDPDAESLNLSPPPSPIIRRAGAHHQQGVSSVSRVDIGYFDPAGVNELRRTMTNLNAAKEEKNKKRKGGERPTSAKSDDTLTPSTEPFDFEKNLRELTKKCVYLSSTPALI